MPPSPGAVPRAARGGERKDGGSPLRESDATHWKSSIQFHGFTGIARLTDARRRRRSKELQIHFSGKTRAEGFWPGGTAACDGRPSLAGPLGFRPLLHFGYRRRQ